MLKKSLSILLAVLMVVSTLAIGVVSVSADIVEQPTYKFTPEDGKLYFDVANTGWTMGTKNKVAFRVYDGDIPDGVDYWGSKKVIGTKVAGEDTVYEIDLKEKVGLEFTPGIQYKIIFVRTEGSNWTDQCYDLFMTSDCLGHVAYGDQNIKYENPVDSSKTTIAAFWYGMDPAEYGPVLQVSSIGNVVGTCPAAGQTPYDVFVDFITLVDEKMGSTKLVNARKYTVDSHKKTEQEMIDDIGAGLGLTKDDVKQAFEDNPMDKGIEDPENPGQYTIEPKEVTTVWSYDASTLPAATPVHVHTPGEPVQENIVPATCIAGGSYDSVVYCTECGEEISRENVDTDIDPAAHSIVHKDLVPATETENGIKEHYECEHCGKCFSDAEGQNEVTPESLIIVAEHIRGDANADKEVDTVDVTTIQRKLVGFEVPSFDSTAADTDLDGVVDIIDATLLQRVLADMTTFEAWDAKHLS